MDGRSYAEDSQKNLAYEHAWRMFDKHAKQRVQCLNYYILIFAAMFASSARIYASEDPLVFSLLGSILFPLITYVFHRFEIRNSQLIKLSERPLIKIEDTLYLKSGVDVWFIRKSDRLSSATGISYGGSFKILFYFGYILSILVFGYFLYNLAVCLS